MRILKPFICAGLLGLAAVTVVSCGNPAAKPLSTSSTAAAQTTSTAAAFSATIDNQYLPLIPGTKWVYEQGNFKAIAVVMSRTKIVDGVTCLGVHDSEYTKGKLTEDTIDWYSQAADGTVYAYSEDSADIKNGKIVSRSGSWTAGVSGAKPCIAMEADPKVGDTYALEDLKGNAEDHAEVTKVGETVTVSGKTYTNCVRTKVWSPLEPGNISQKVFAPGVGCIIDEGAKLTQFAPAGSSSTTSAS